MPRKREQIFKDDITNDSLSQAREDWNEMKENKIFWQQISEEHKSFSYTWSSFVSVCTIESEIQTKRSVSYKSALILLKQCKTGPQLQVIVSTLCWYIKYENPGGRGRSRQLQFNRICIGQKSGVYWIKNGVKTVRIFKEGKQNIY